MSEFATKYAAVFAALCRPFEDDQVRIRQQAGRELTYVTASTVANRLDDVLGPENWEFDVAPWGEHDLIGTLSVTLPDGRVVRKKNVGGRADMPEGDNDAKSAASDCLKRCAALFGVARYLYGCGHPEFADPMFQGFAGHQNTRRDAAPASHQGGNGNYQRNGGGGGRDGINREFRPSPAGECPRDGRKLWGWCLDRQKEGDVDVVKRVSAVLERKFGWCRMVELTGDQVAQAWPEISGGGSSAPAGVRNPRDEEDIPY